MTPTHSMAHQIGDAAIAFEEQRLGRRPKSVAVMLGGNTLVVTMHGVLSRGEMALAETSEGAAKLQEFHQELFGVSSDPLRKEITRITGLDVSERAAAAVQVFPTGTVVQVFLLQGHVLDADQWNGT